MKFEAIIEKNALQLIGVTAEGIISTTKLAYFSIIPNL